MGSSISRRKERLKICKTCPSKCDKNPTGENPSFAAKKSHKIDRLQRAMNQLFMYCIHYNDLK